MTLLGNSKKAAREQKFDALYRRYGQMMYGIAYRILGHPQDAEDAVSEALKNF